MIQSSLSVVAENLLSFMYVGSLFAWGYMYLVLMEVLICKDGRHVKFNNLLNKSISLRFIMLKRNFRNLFYRISAGLFISSIIAILVLMFQLWNNVPKDTGWVFFHCITPICLIYLYHYLGHDAAFFVKFILFLKGEL